jgi:hypothetical protein
MLGIARFSFFFFPSSFSFFFSLSLLLEQSPRRRYRRDLLTENFQSELISNRAAYRCTARSALSFYLKSRVVYSRISIKVQILMDTIMSISLGILGLPS